MPASVNAPEMRRGIVETPWYQASRIVVVHLFVMSAPLGYASLTPLPPPPQRRSFTCHDRPVWNASRRGGYRRPRQ